MKHDDFLTCEICDKKEHFSCLEDEIIKSKRQLCSECWEKKDCKVWGLNPYHKRRCYIHNAPAAILNGCGRLLCKECFYDLKSEMGKVLDDRVLEQYIRYVLNTKTTYLELPDPLTMWDLDLEPTLTRRLDLNTIPQQTPKKRKLGHDVSLPEKEDKDKPSKRDPNSFSEVADKKRKTEKVKSRDKYDAEAKQFDNHKCEENQLFFLELTQIRKQQNTWGDLLVLDARTFNTSEHARLSGYKPHQIFVPNNGGDAEEMLSRSGEYSTVVKMSAEEFICQRLKNTPFQGVFLDYCGTARIYIDDINLLFVRKLLCDHSVLACTFSKRVGGGWKEDRDKAYGKIEQAAFCGDYIIERLHELDYNQMYFFCLRVQRKK